MNVGAAVLVLVLAAAVALAAPPAAERGVLGIPGGDGVIFIKARGTARVLHAVMSAINLQMRCAEFPILNLL